MFDFPNFFPLSPMNPLDEERRRASFDVQVVSRILQPNAENIERWKGFFKGKQFYYVGGQRNRAPREGQNWDHRYTYKSKDYSSSSLPSFEKHLHPVLFFMFLQQFFLPKAKWECRVRRGVDFSPLHPFYITRLYGS